MAYPERFTVAASHMQPALEDSTSFSNEIKLALYALHQQATVGPCNQPKPWGWNAASNAKWQAWRELGDLSSMEAMRLYVRTLDEEAPGWVKDIDLPGTANGGSQEAGGEEVETGPVDAEAPSPAAARPALAAATSPAAAAPAFPRMPPSKPRSVAEVVVEGSWVSPFISSPRRPTPRYEHAVALLGSRAFIVGGSYSGRYLGDTWALDLESLAWSAVTPRDSGGALPPVSGHAAVAWGGGVLAVGGHTRSREARSTAGHLPVRSLDPGTGTWTEVETRWAARGTGVGATTPDSDTESEEGAGAGSPPPVSRGGHTATLLGSTLWVFGGEDASRRALGELLTLDLASMRWLSPAATGPAPAPRTAHAAVAWRERYLLVFGGGSVAHCFNDLHVLDTASMEWSVPEVEGPLPPPRAGHATALLGSTWYVVGGGNNQAGCADMYALELSGLGRGEPLVWTLVGNTPPASAIASEGLSLQAVPMAGCLVSFGGYNGRYHNSVHVYRPEGYVVVKPGSGSGRLTDVGPLDGIRAGTPQVAGPQDDIERKSSETATARREAEVAKESVSQELGLLRRQLATTQAALADAEQAARNREAALADEQAKVVKLEVEVAELKSALAHMGELERELASYRQQAATPEAPKSTGLWGFISGADANAGRGS